MFSLLSKIGEEQSAEDAEDGPPELLVSDTQKSRSLSHVTQTHIFHIHISGHETVLHINTNSSAGNVTGEPFSTTTIPVHLTSSQKSIIIHIYWLVSDIVTAN